jgi:hypothetical protein
MVTDTDRKAVEFSQGQLFGSFCFKNTRAQTRKKFPKTY